MISKKPLSGLAISFFLLQVVQFSICPAQAMAKDVTPLIEYTYYNLTIPDVDDPLLMAQMISSSMPVLDTGHEAGKGYAGYTAWSFSFGCEVKSAGRSTCALKNCQVTATCEIRMPRITNNDPVVHEAFAGYMEIIKAHELNHCKIAATHATAFQKRLGLYSENECAQLNEQAKLDHLLALKACGDAQTEYDRRTQNGFLEGSDLRNPAKQLVKLRRQQKPRRNMKKAINGIYSERGGSVPESGPLNTLDNSPEAMSEVYKDGNGVWRSKSENPQFYKDENGVWRNR